MGGGGGGYSIWKSIVGFQSVWLFVFMLLFKKRNFMVSRTILGGKFSIRYDNHLPKRKEDKEGKHILQQGVLRKMSKKSRVFWIQRELTLRTVVAAVKKILPSGKGRTAGTWCRPRPDMFLQKSVIFHISTLHIVGIRTCLFFCGWM